MVKPTIHIAIIEPSSIIFEGLASILLKSAYHFHIIRAENIAEYEQSGIKQSIDIVLINPSQIQHNIRNFKQIKRADSRVIWAALVYSYYDKEVIELFDKVLQINDSPENIVTSIYHQFTSSSEIKDTQHNEHLTERETDVLIKLVHGLSNKEIADKLNISIHTVVSHRKNIIQKTGIKSQAGLAIYAISHKIVSIDTLPHIGK